MNMLLFLVFFNEKTVLEGFRPQNSLRSQGLLSKITERCDESQRSLLKPFLQPEQEPFEAAPKALVSIEELRPSCFGPCGHHQSHCSFPSMASWASSDEEPADFEPLETSPTVLTSMQRHGFSTL